MNHMNIIALFKSALISLKKRCLHVYGKLRKIHFTVFTVDTLLHALCFSSGQQMNKKVSELL